MTEEQLNCTVAEEFAKEYARETGRQLSIKDCSRDFPDVVLESNGSELWMELVSIPLAFLPQEITARRRFTQAVVSRMRASEPDIQNYTLQFQFISSSPVRPIRLPKTNTADWQEMLQEADDLLRNRLFQISDSGGILLAHAARDFSIPVPTLARYFEAILVQKVPPGGGAPGETTVHTNLDELRVIDNSLARKRDKQYRAHILLLHTFSKEDATDRSLPLTLMGMKGPELIELTRQILSSPEHKPTLDRFREIWLLNRIICGGKRLFRIVAP